MILEIDDDTKRLWHASIDMEKVLAEKQRRFCQSHRTSHRWVCDC